METWTAGWCRKLVPWPGRVRQGGSGGRLQMRGWQAGRLARGDRWKRMRGRFKVVEQDPGNLDFQWHTQCCQSCAGQLVLFLIFHFWGQDYIWVCVDSPTVPSTFASDLLIRVYWEQTTWNLIGWSPSHPTSGADEDRCSLFFVGWRFCLFPYPFCGQQLGQRELASGGAILGGVSPLPLILNLWGRVTCFNLTGCFSSPFSLVFADRVRKTGFLRPLLQLECAWMLSQSCRRLLRRGLQGTRGVIHDPSPYLRVKVISAYNPGRRGISASRTGPIFAGHFNSTHFLRIWYFGFQVSPWWW